MPVRAVFNQLGSLFTAALPAGQPPLARANYRRELLSVGFLGLATSCVEGGVVGVIASKAFGASSFIVALLTAAPAISNLSAVLWTRLIQGRDRVRAVNLFQIGVVCCVLVMACVPISDAGLAVLVTAAITARCLLTGMIAARTDLWRANYPRHRRARMIGNITLLASFVVGATALALGWAMDIGPRAFTAVFGISVLSGAVGIRVFSTIRWRGRAVHMRAERQHLDSEAGARRAANLRAMIDVLRQDRFYRRFMAAQFMLGMPQLAAIPVFILAIKDLFSLGYRESLLLTQTLPVIVPVLVIPLWAPLLDRSHIVRFRSWHSWVFVAANVLMFASCRWQNESLLYISRIVLGVATGGGMLAWELGHHDFAKREQAAVYMGVHVFLTGIRGVFSPFLGTLLYAGATASILGVPVAVPALGAWTFAALACLSACAALMFMSLARRMQKVGADSGGATPTGEKAEAAGA